MTKDFREEKREIKLVCLGIFLLDRSAAEEQERYCAAVEMD